MSYDHHRKAGNEGDCVKHPALIAALDDILCQPPEGGVGVTNKPFHYLDVFAGHAWHPLLDAGDVPGVQKALEWKKGIGTLHKKLLNASEELNEHVLRWQDWYLPDRPSLVRGWYPGSSVIAADMCRKHDRHVRMTVFDISDEVHDDLRRWFLPVHPTDLTKSDWCVIGRSLDATAVKEGGIREPDFVFIDPPGWQSEKNATYPKWENMLEHVLTPRADRPTLMWMPAGGQDRTKNKKDQSKENSGAYPWDETSKGDLPKKCDELVRIGFRWTAVRWQKNSYSACILVYNCAVAEIRAAVDCIVRIAGWGSGGNRFEAVKHSNGTSASV